MHTSAEPLSERSIRRIRNDKWSEHVEWQLSGTNQANELTISVNYARLRHEFNYHVITYEVIIAGALAAANAHSSYNDHPSPSSLPTIRHKHSPFHAAVQADVTR